MSGPAYDDYEFRGRGLVPPIRHVVRRHRAVVTDDRTASCDDGELVSPTASAAGGGGE